MPTLTVDLDRVDVRIADLERELLELREFRQRVNEFSVGDPSPRRRAGRPRNDEIRSILKTFIGNQYGEFTNMDMKNAINGHGETAPKYKFRATINELVKSGELIELAKPAGVRLGKYKKGSS